MPDNSELALAFAHIDILVTTWTGLSGYEMNNEYDACRKCRVKVTVQMAASGENIKNCDKCKKYLTANDIMREWNALVQIKIGGWLQIY